MKVSQEKIKEFLKGMLSTNKMWALHALARIYDNQTWDERDDKNTKYYNGVGFTGVDAHFLSSLASQYEEKHFLSDKQLAYLFKKIPKYWHQIWIISDQEKLIKMIGE
jgi:hypothetical protein